MQEFYNSRPSLGIKYKQVIDEEYHPLPFNVMNEEILSQQVCKQLYQLSFQTWKGY